MVTLLAKSSVRILFIAICAARFVSSFSLTPHQCRTRPIDNREIPDALVSGRRPKKTSPASETALNVSGGAFVPTTTASVLGAINTFYKTYPVMSSVGTCSIKGCLADLIAQRSNRVADDGTVLDHAPAFSFRRNFAYIVYSGMVIGLLCEFVYHHLYPRLFGKIANATSKLVATVAFDNFIIAPLVWLPPIYFLKALLYGKPFMSGGKSYICDVRNEGLWTAYWKIWIPAQIFNFWKVPSHLRVAFMACTSFFWMIILSCLSSNKKQ